jgi:hypothetical protein
MLSTRLDEEWHQETERYFTVQALANNKEMAAKPLCRPSC